MSVHNYQFKLANENQEIQAYFALRHCIFVEEQEIFTTDDQDDIDQIAHPIVAIDKNTKATPINILKVNPEFICVIVKLYLFNIVFIVSFLTIAFIT